MAFTKLVSFDRPLASAALPGQGGRFYREAELSARDEASYRRGFDAARVQADQQIVELRTDMQNLGNGVFQKIATVEPALLAQIRDALPMLAVEIARRLLAGFEPPPEVIAKLCEEALGELFPERENLELVVSTRDAALLQELNPEWLARYPGLRIRAEASFKPGDCQVRSRFGLTDARLQVKLNALQHNLVPA